jgi:hypothetical protein
MAAGEVPEARIKHAISSSNLPYFEALWSAAKQSSEIVAIHKRFYWDPPPRRGPEKKAAPKQSNENKSNRSKKASALVDIVAENGAQWIKVSTVTSSRLIHEMARQGWGYDDLSSDEDEGSKQDDNDSDDDDTAVSIVKMSEDLLKSSRAVRVRYQHPRIRFVLPKLWTGEVPEIDTLIASIRAKTGAEILCAEDLRPAPRLADAQARMTVDEFQHFSPTLNVDCTVLLALVSDLSHTTVAPSPALHRAVQRQIEMEAADALLPHSLYPAMGARRLVCTAAAAARMREIVATIGTDTEVARTAVLLADAPAAAAGPAREARVAEFQRLSDNPVPADWRLPIEIIPARYDLAALPPVAARVADELSDINKSVFLHGWANGLTTISSNRTVAKQIEAIIEENRDSEELVGPDVWLCSMARSLVGKDKKRK